MYLVDTNIISEQRKRARANPGVLAFFEDAAANGREIFLSVITLGELRRGVELKRFRGDHRQCHVLDDWVLAVHRRHTRNILGIDAQIVELWGHLSVPDTQNSLDKLIAATALVHGLTVVTRNVRDFANTGVRILNPFSDVPSVRRVLALCPRLFRGRSQAAQY
ncbi:twitching motility protein PilT [Cupriavidus sp. HMR-1]|uniref:type II toxin-antitoxin system VapC family toxin n=1 Tax=Cupriavidus sp. HMR-1 TaxID=1249621 RepID=UPI0002A3C3B7|nr:type II toxin-antitoxin system VapC family toxin [Cupriavidus sp. HMR-1]EKZ97765.1 twitching motility protein PilT [Cupriavidus sp. HMR-1]